MICMMDRLLKSQRGDLSALVLHHTVVLLLQLHFGGGQSMVAMVGDDIILPCHLEPAVDATDLTVEWVRPDLEPRFVHLRRDSHELQLEEHPLYKGRTSLSTNRLKCGDISLKLSKVKLSDAGTYMCLVLQAGTDTVELTVVSVSSPEIEISKVSNGVLLQCKSKAWYPEPEVLWLDGEGNLLSAGPTETIRGPDDLYTVSSRVTVEKRHSNSFTCRLHQKNTNQTRETHIYVPAAVFMVQSSSTIRIIICLAVCSMSIVAVVFVVWKWGRNKIKTTNNSIELQLLMEGEGDREKLMTKSEKITYLDKTKAKLDEELQHLEQLMTTLMNQKEDLKNQREKLISLQQEDKTQLAQHKNKKPPKMDKDNKMKKRETTQNNLEKRKKEHVELLESTDKLLVTTEGIIMKMILRKGELQGHKEKIIQYVKETVRQREELQMEHQQEQSEREEKNNPTIQ